VAAKANGAPADVLDKARKLQQKAQWRLDFIAAENSMGFHAPQEAAKVLGEAVDYARQGQITLLGGVATSPAKAPAESAAAAAGPPAIPPASASARP
jgi:nitrite reductase (cytochrome c-552)